MSPRPATGRSSISSMPRGGPNASWLDRKLQTDRLEYTDRYDVPDRVKQAVISSLDQVGRWWHVDEKVARVALEMVKYTPVPRILELGAGHGNLSARIIALHPSATVTVSDVDPVSVRNIATGPLCEEGRVTPKVIDARSIREPDGSYDLVILAGAFHHLPPAVACEAIAEATRVGRQFLIVDVIRPRPMVLLLAIALQALVCLPFAVVPRLAPFIHDGLISRLRTYSKSAYYALAGASAPGITVDISGKRITGTPLSSIVMSRPHHPSSIHMN
ncbi:class I SAM-dependent methyltransferase [Mycobacteroides abscessus subsp. abscessus]|uniref:class I SAM-dependent methyltransferase n=1 Tax=Mycobacteroides abscessus TaxID=36809 RepID=UPI00266DCFD6|nr:class I SAM-dependent methyltransferase [Mycobacteroides abscessus]MDO3340095.1 class I SAM-dependent methyltransferase [Mycobacteroides abscessus subsp. abscessus]